MKILNKTYKDRVVRSLAGSVIVFLLILQKLLLVDLTVVIFIVGLNLFQYGLTGWCPFALYFTKIGWLRGE
jgi:hypothetical protein